MNEYIAKYKQLDLPGKLIAINIIIWAILQISRLFHWLLTGDDLYWQQWLALPADLSCFIYKPWTILTYFFTHANLGSNIFHIIFNMLWLWWFGHFFLRDHTSRQLLSVYLLGGLSAGVVFLLSYNLLPGLMPYQHDIVVGASGAIFALVAAVAIHQPDEPIYLNFFIKVIPVKLKWFALIALLINLMNLSNGANTGGIICHLGGALFGCIFGLCERNNMDISSHFSRWIDALSTMFKSRPKMKATRGGATHIPNDRKADHDYNQRKHVQQQRIDAILDKISKSGYNGLTAEEKALLFDASQRKKS